ncbi:SH3 domain-containing protein [Streptomyces sp. 8P21H-1]|nr:SH3 domain-containing protein [Streptomyces sp. 8P21H-1]
MASPTGVLSCSHAWSNKSAQESIVYGDGVNLRSGPHSGSGGCSIIGQLQAGERLYAHCWDTGTAVNDDQAWWHVRRQSNNQNGWVSNWYTAFQTNNGSHC